MNIFSSCGNNTCLWILILLLLAAGFTGNSLDDILSGSCTPILLALLTACGKTERSPVCYAAATATTDADVTNQ